MDVGFCLCCPFTSWVTLTGYFTSLDLFLHLSNMVIAGPNSLYRYSKGQGAMGRGRGLWASQIPAFFLNLNGSETPCQAQGMGLKISRVVVGVE